MKVKNTYAFRHRAKPTKFLSGLKVFPMRGSDWWSSRRVVEEKGRLRR